MFRMFVIATALLGLGACTVQYKMVGKFDNYNELFVGDLVHDLSVGVADITAVAEKSGITCTGKSRVTYIPPFSMGCAGQSGVAKLTCSDGRIANADWSATSCTTGFGDGTTNDGTTFNFTFGLTKEEAEARLIQMRPTVANKPDLPVYRPKETRKEIGFSTGTGFFVTDAGHMITNYHVVEDAKEIAVQIGGDFKKAEILKSDPANDIVLLKIDAMTSPLPIPDGTSMARADEVFTLGYPDISIQGQAQKATFGRINSLSGIQDDVRFFQIDVPIQPGNSGGPLVNEKGQVVGVVTMTLNAIVSLIERGSLPQNVNYAVKTDYVVPLLRDVDGWKPQTEGGDSNLKQYVAEYEKAVTLVVAK